MEYRRKKKEDRPVLAICYDFDRTLSPDDMQAQGYIQSIGFDPARFWEESNKRARENRMDSNLAYMLKMVEGAAEKQILFTRELLNDYGSRVKLFPGLMEWFSRIRSYGEAQGVIVEHYIISSGLREMIEGTAIAGEFEAIYASSFYYDEKGVAKWPAQVINYTNKTQYLFRIEKGTLDENDPAVNDYFEAGQMRVPFRNMVYIGDSDTDIPCMKLVNSNQGHSIGVYDPQTKDIKKVRKMLLENRIKYFVPGDYTKDSPLDQLVKNIIEKTASYEKLEEWHLENKAEAQSGLRF